MKNGKIISQLFEIQQKLKAPKNLKNTFGKYNYRSCEAILEAVKPILKEVECIVVLTDQVHPSGNRFYIEATATLYNKDGESFPVSAYAREEDFKKGMDASQVTGAASSYARKYALNGLFAIDDTKDADALNTNKDFTDPAVNTPAKQLSSQGAVAMALAATSREELNSVWKANVHLHNDATFKKAAEDMAKKFPKENKDIS